MARGLLQGVGMFHHRAWAPKGSLLFRNPLEADLLWKCVVDAFPELDCLCLMPNHLHLALPHADREGRLARMEAAFARARNALRGEKGRVFDPHPPVEEIPPERRARMRRYILLNPCRAELASDPLAWRWSTHRDRCGLTARRIGPLDRDPEAFHRYISDDPTVKVGGTPFPAARSDQVEWEDVAAAVIQVCRCDAAALARRGRPRELFVQAAWILGHTDRQRLMSETGLRRARVYGLIDGLPHRSAPIAPPDLAAVVRVAGDPRFG